jgi:ABC-type maltose transport system permease subunit
MSAPSHPSTDSAAEKDGVEAIVPLMPIVLPLVGAVTMLLIAFIAVFMA